MVVACVAKVELTQQLQAVVPFNFMQVSTMLLKVPIAVKQAETYRKVNYQKFI